MHKRKDIFSDIFYENHHKIMDIKAASFFNKEKTMERLTVRGSVVSQRDINKLLEPSDENQFGANNAYYKLKYYEDLEEQGRLIELPCKVGDMVYVISEEKCKYWLTAPCWNCEGTCSKEACYTPYQTINEYPFTLYMFDAFGKTVFLSREEAELVLHKLEALQIIADGGITVAEEK